MGRLLEHHSLYSYYTIPYYAILNYTVLAGCYYLLLYDTSDCDLHALPGFPSPTFEKVASPSQATRAQVVADSKFLARALLG